MSDINEYVVSTRVRLARNIEGYPFPNKLRDNRSSIIAKNVYESLGNDRNYDLYKMNKISEIDASVLKEKHLISDNLMANNQFSSAIISQDETISIMINEEDHVREQCILPGFQLNDAYNIIDEIDDKISDKINFCYNDKLGYLTSCPTNLGTGMRASVMMFLPALTITKALSSCINATSRLGMTVRGVYGEGSGADGYLYQVSNERTLGISEQEILKLVEGTVNHLAEMEERARQSLMEQSKVQLTDNIMRSYGIATNAYMISSGELMSVLAMIKLGVYYKIIKNVDTKLIDKLIVDCMPANLITLAPKKLENTQDRDIFRAEYVREMIKKQ